MTKKNAQKRILVQKLSGKTNKYQESCREIEGSPRSAKDLAKKSWKIQE